MEFLKVCQPLESPSLIVSLFGDSTHDKRDKIIGIMIYSSKKDTVDEVMEMQARMTVGSWKMMKKKKEEQNCIRHSFLAVNIVVARERGIQQQG